MSKNTRWSGKPEFWFNKKKNVVIVRESDIFFWALNLNDPNKDHFEFHVSKNAGSFDFFNCTKHLKDKGFSLVGRF